MKHLFLVLSVASLLSCKSSDKKVETPADNPLLAVSENPEIEKAVDDAYKSISFRKRESMDTVAIKKYFIPRAQFIINADTPQVFGLDPFIRFYVAFIDSNKVNSFYEEEISGKTEQFGNIAHRLSSYKTYINSTDSISQRGVNSFQLVKTPAGWKVSSIIWDVETDQQKIPEWLLTAPPVKKAAP